MASESIWFQIMRTMRERIVALNLPDIREDQIFVRKLPFNRDHVFPGITIYPLAETIKYATNISDDIGYGVQIVLIQASNQDLESNFDRLLLWREGVRQEFSGSQVRNIQGVNGERAWNIEVSSGAVILPEAFVKGYDVSALLCRVTGREGCRR